MCFIFYQLTWKKTSLRFTNTEQRPKPAKPKQRDSGLPFLFPNTRVVIFGKKYAIKKENTKSPYYSVEIFFLKHIQAIIKELFSFIKKLSLIMVPNIIKKRFLEFGIENCQTDNHAYSLVRKMRFSKTNQGCHQLKW